MAQWLLMHDNPNIRYADVMNPGVWTLGGVSVTSVNMNVSVLDGQEGFFSRKASGKAERLHNSDSKQDQRQSAIKARLQSDFASGMNKEINRRDLEKYQAEHQATPQVETISVKNLPVKQNEATQHAPTVATKPAPQAQQIIIKRN